MFTYDIDENLKLKILSYNDYEELFLLIDRSRNYLMEWLPWLNFNTKAEDSLNFIKNSLKGFSANNSLDTAIFYKDEIAGILGFNSINWNNKTAYIGYWLGEEYQGLGIMSKGTAALINHAFYNLDLNKVEIRVASNNVKSRKIPERLKFTNEGCIREAEWLYDHFVDHIVYGMLKEEWAELRDNDSL